jgi:hypothetical protein
MTTIKKMKGVILKYVKNLQLNFILLNNNKVARKGKGETSF